MNQPSSSSSLSKEELISNVLELQETLDDLAHRVDGIQTENTILKEENVVLSQYIDTLLEKMIPSPNFLTAKDLGQESESLNILLSSILKTSQ